jgi:primosomal protein N' (replication factor Y)
LSRHFDYLLPDDLPVPAAGTRVRVPFGRRETIGVVLEVAGESVVPDDRLRPVKRVLDSAPLLPPRMLELLTWAAGYYHHPIGEVLHSALPVLLRRGAAPGAAAEERFVLTATGRQIEPASLRRSPLRARVHAALAAQPEGLTATALSAVSDSWRGAIRHFLELGWVEARDEPCLKPFAAAPAAPPPALSTEQADAVAAIDAVAGQFHCLLVHGVTGSGKTEVYLRAIEDAVARGGQALVLVPEIGLTPQLVARFAGRIAAPIAVLHSGMNDSERLCAWQAARSGEAAVVIGTRSAVFTPLPRLALIVIDEEHDASFKQQDGFRYHARDVAIKRARLEAVPVVLGSATPSLESFHNAERARYQLLTLPARAGDARPPQVRLLDLRRLKLTEGLSPPLLEALQARLARGEQSLLFLNRRGFAPVLMCHDCGWLAPCRRCDARLTVHRRSGALRCHHCGVEAPLPQVCPDCGSGNLHGIGEGTERIEERLTRLFPAARIERIDRDSTRRKGALEEKLRRVHAGEADILVGTQMLAKGHDFPELTLVGVLNADQGLYSADFRSEERLVQQLVQVTGRAGRGRKPGEVLVQTWQPDNPAFAALAHHDYGEFARFALAEREQAGYPPYAFLALLRAESTRAGAALAFLHAARALAGAAGIPPGVVLMDPVASPMERRAGRYRAQLLVQAGERRALHTLLGAWLARLEAEPRSRQVRWSLDVDPVDLY